MRSALVLGALLLAASASASAQTRAPSRTGLPGLNRVGVVDEEAPRLTGTLTAGFSYTESILDDADSHVRVPVGLAIAGRPVGPLAIGLSLDGRYNHSSSTSGGSLDTFVLDPHLRVRLGTSFDAFRIGAELELIVPPGEDGLSLDFDGTSFEAEALAAWAPRDGRFAVALNAGYRFDQTGTSAPQGASRLERVSLDVSDFGALVLGLGASFAPSESVELYAEARWDILVGDGAPGLGASPLRIGPGVRVRPSAGLPMWIYGSVEVNASGYDVRDMGAFAPTPPRFTVLVGASLSLESDTDTDDAETETDAETDTDTETETDTDAATETATETDAATETETGTDTETGTETEVPAAPETQLRGLIRGFDGQPLGATVTIEPGGLRIETDAEGEFEVEVEAGNYEVTIEARGHRAQTRRIRVDEGGVTVLNVELYRRQ